VISEGLALSEVEGLFNKRGAEKKTFFSSILFPPEENLLDITRTVVSVRFSSGKNMIKENWRKLIM